MSIAAIPNPTKKLNLDFSIEKVKSSIKEIPYLKKEYQLKNFNEVFNLFTFEAFEFLSLGIFADINLNSISENKTEINIEIRRKLGSFNQSHEVTLANKHIEQLIDLIGKSILLSDEDIILLKQQKVKITQTKVYSKNKNTALILCLLLGYLGVHRFYSGHTGIGIIQLLTFGGFGLWWLIDFILIIAGNYKDSNNNVLI